MTELLRYDYTIQKLLPKLWLRGMHAAEMSEEPVPGDLVMLQSAPDSEWHLSWYVQDQGSDNHLLESLKTGKLCKWGNVGFVIIDRKWVSERERMRWTDKQFAFEKMFEAEFTKGCFYQHLPFIERFEGDNLFVTFRIRFGSADDTRTKAEPFNIEGASRADLRCHLWKWLAIHKRNDDAARAAKRTAQQAQ